MRAFIIRRLIQSLVLIMIVSVINFLILRATPGDPLTTAKFTTRGLPAAVQKNQLEELEQRLHIYTDPLPVAFLEWVGKALTLDFGYSVQTGQPVGPEVAAAATTSFWLLMRGVLVGLIGIPLGIYAALHQGSLRDKLIQLLTTLFTTLPGWYLALFIAFLNIQIYQASGKTFSFLPYYALSDKTQQINPELLQIWLMVLPTLLLGATFLARFCSYVRTQTLGILKEDYIRTAHAKGLPARIVLTRHVLRNSLSPVISLFGGLIPFIFGTQLLIEYATGTSGIGTLFLSGVSSRDYTLLMAIFSFIAVACITTSLVADLIYALVDPKVREKGI